MSSNSSTKQLPHPHPHPPSNKSRATATAALFLGLGLVLAVLAAITNYTANTIVHNNLHDILPINTRNLHLYAHYNSIISFYIYDYINIRNASNGTSIALKQTGPFILYNSYHWYNVSISDYTVRYMMRNTFKFENEYKAKNTFVTVPSMRYISIIGNSHASVLVESLQDAISLIQNYFQTSIVPNIRRMCVPLYIEYFMKFSLDAKGDFLRWSNLNTVFIHSRALHPLSRAIPDKVLDYLIFQNSTFSLTKLTINRSDEHVSAWFACIANVSLCSVIEQDIKIATNLQSSIVLQSLNITKLWLSSLMTSESYFQVIRDMLIASKVIPVAQISQVKTFNDLGILQFSRGNLIQKLSFGNFFSTSSLKSFPEPPLTGPLELALYISRYNEKSTATFSDLFLTVQNCSSFLDLVRDRSRLFSFLSAALAGREFLPTMYKAIGVSRDNLDSIVSYTKHLVRIKIISSETRRIPPINSSDPGLFVRISVFDLLNSFADPNFRDGSFTTNQPRSFFIQNYSSDNDHWIENPNSWNLKKTGNSQLSEVNEIVKYEGRSIVLGFWGNDETISGSRDFRSSIPFHDEDILDAYKIWDYRILRSVSYFLNRSLDYRGFFARRYIPNDSMYQNESRNPLNSMYYMNGPNGLINMEPQGGFPVWYSLPHFLGADEYVKDAFLPGSFRPDKDLHLPFADVEPLSGTVLRKSDRYQVNLKLRRMDWFSEPSYGAMFNKREEIYAPILWFDESFQIDPSISSNLYDLTFRIRFVGSILTVVFSIFAVIFLVFAVFVFHTARAIKKSMVRRAESVKNVNL